MNLRPLGDRVVIKRMEAEEKTQSGIFIPTTAKEQPQMAEVIAVGTEVKSDELKVGDKVIFSQYGGTEVSLDKVELIVLKLEEILAVVE